MKPLLDTMNAAEWCREQDAHVGDRISAPAYWTGFREILSIREEEIVVAHDAGYARVCRSLPTNATLEGKR